MEYSPGNAQSIGSREQQQDAYGFSDLNSDTQRGMVVVADGMGGLECGDQASKLAVNAFLNGFDQPNRGTIPQILLKFAKNAQKSIWDLADSVGQAGNVGSTLVASWIEGDKLYFISIGDSRVYLYRNNEIHQLTEDHSYSRDLFKLVAKGEITKQQALDDPQFDALVSFLGCDNLELIDQNIKSMILKTGDSIVLCSDGIYRGLEREEWVSVLKNSDFSAQDKAEKLLNKVLYKHRKNQDNATIALIDVTDKAISTAPSALLEKKSSVSLFYTNKLLVGLLFVSVILLVFIYWSTTQEELQVDSVANTELKSKDQIKQKLQAEATELTVPSNAENKTPVFGNEPSAEIEPKTQPESSKPVVSIAPQDNPPVLENEPLDEIEPKIQPESSKPVVLITPQDNIPLLENEPLDEIEPKIQPESSKPVASVAPQVNIPILENEPLDEIGPKTQPEILKPVVSITPQGTGSLPVNKSEEKAKPKKSDENANSIAPTSDNEEGFLCSALGWFCENEKIEKSKDDSSEVGTVPDTKSES